MSESLEAQLEKLRNAAAGLESQRAMLGEAVVEPALAALHQQIAALEAQQQVQAVPAPTEERRVITILFSDVIGSVTFAEKLDPEVWRHTIAQVQSTIGQIVVQHHGMISQYQGDALIAFFGAHETSEYDPENAIRAGLTAQSAIADLNTEPKVQTRVGIHTGLVVLGEWGADAKIEFAAFGDAVNVAARLQSAAPAGGVLISHDTYRYVRGVFDVTPQPPLTLKGKSEPIQTYLVRRAKARPFRSVARGVAGVETRTIGRDAEIKQLQEAYLDASENRRVVWAQLVGELGVGKSRLLSDVNDWIDLREETTRLFRARASANDVNQPFALIRRMWFDRFQIAEDAPLAQAEAKWVQQFIEFRGKEDIEAAHALGLLVGLSFNDSPYIGAMRNDPTQVKGRAFVVSRELFAAIRARQPIVMLLEDLQWADAASVEYLMEVIVQGNGGNKGDRQGLFVLAAARGEWKVPQALTVIATPSGAKGMQSPSPDEIATPPSAARTDNVHYLQIHLAPLTDAATRDLARELLQGVQDVPDEAIRLIVERAEGVPYFAEEMVNWFFDRGIIDKSREPWRFVVTRLRESPLPATLQHLLLTRLSSLNDIERAALQRGAIFGRNFWTGGVEALGVRQSQVLGHLQARGFVVAQPESALVGEREWSFHHALLREVTYESVLKRERAGLHKAAGQWLEAQARRAGRLDEFAGLLGEHAERAGEMSAASDWFLQAGERAARQGAPREAKIFFDRALELLPPIERERRWRALLGREEALSVLGEREPQRADLSALLELAQQMEDSQRLAEAYLRQARRYGLNITDFRAAVKAADDAIAIAHRANLRAIEARALAVKAFGLTHVADLSSARAAAEEALARAQELGDDETLAFVLSTVAPYYGESGDLARTAQLRTQQVAISHRLGDRVTEATALVGMGNSYIMFLGLYKLGRTALQQGLELAETIGARATRANALHTLGVFHWRTGDNRAARQMLEQALFEFVATKNSFTHAYALYHLGLVLEESGDVSRAARRFAQALEIFETLGTSRDVSDPRAGLARCALAQGRLDEARQYVTEIWNYLNEQGAKGLQYPVLVYQTCADIFDALGEKEQARTAVQEGYRELMDLADKISEPAWRKAFLENISEHRTMVEMWEKIT